MNVRLIIILSLASLFSCDSDISKSNQVTDLTKYRSFNSALSNTPNQEPLGKLQLDYNNEKIQFFEDALKEIKIESLKKLESPIQAYRLVVCLSWSRSWAKTPLALTIYKHEDSTLVETVEPNPLNLHGSDDTQIQSTHSLHYKVAAQNFEHLEQVINNQGLWDDFSFHENNGWRTLDGSDFFIEMRNGQAYKFLAREEEVTSIYKNLFLPFLRATKYNDSLANAMELMYKREATEMKLRNIKLGEPLR